MAISSGGEIEGVVTRVVDGDTFYISGTTTRIRLWGLDAPERAHAAGPAATRELKRLAEGRRVTCRKVDEDRYGRIVGQCFLSDGDDIAALMIKSGTAREFLRYSGGYYSAGGLFGRRE
ncbi:thermonuclease family protein [Hyphococcus sp.]|uniref:thermonuclease family protein n=1 Tax=Hyphococcus sp. TaxID=2038636 RepID=UPI003CCC0F6F